MSATLEGTEPRKRPHQLITSSQAGCCFEQREQSIALWEKLDGPTSQLDHNRVRLEEQKQAKISGIIQSQYSHSSPTQLNRVISIQRAELRINYPFPACECIIANRIKYTQQKVTKKCKEIRKSHLYYSSLASFVVFLHVSHNAFDEGFPSALGRQLPKLARMFVNFSREGGRCIPPTLILVSHTTLDWGPETRTKNKTQSAILQGTTSQYLPVSIWVRETTVSIKMFKIRATLERKSQLCIQWVLLLKWREI